jgi:hypothetical protein
LEINRIVDNEVGLIIYLYIIPTKLLAIKAQSITVSYVRAYLEYRGIKSHG